MLLEVYNIRQNNIRKKEATKLLPTDVFVITCS